MSKKAHLKKEVYRQLWQLECLDTNYFAYPGLMSLHVTISGRNSLVKEVESANKKARLHNTGIILTPMGHPVILEVDEGTYKQVELAGDGLKQELVIPDKRRSK